VPLRPFNEKNKTESDSESGLGRHRSSLKPQTLFLAFMMEIPESQGGGLSPNSASFFRGQFDLMLVEWSGRGGGKRYGGSEGMKALVSYLVGGS
jgi:hypothetical protein